MSLDPKIVELITELKSLGVNVNANIGLSLTAVTPTPSSKHYYTVTVDKTNARSVKEYNKAGKPVFQIYPSDTSKPSVRKQWTMGQQIWVNPDVVIGDGGARAYEILEAVSGVTVTLYLISTDGTVN
jgi:hypothetical protein